MSGFRAKGLRGAIALATLLAVGVGTSQASAAPLAMEFTEGRANVGMQLSDDPLFAAPATAPFDADIDPASGLISDGSLQVPQFSIHIDDPISADVTVDFEIGVISGSFNQSNGALSLSGTAGGVLAAVGEGQCFVAVPGFLTVTTGGNSGGATPRSGAPFANGLTGSGAIAGTWDDMTAEPVTEEDEWFCGHVEDQIGGPGGVWLQHAGDVVPPAAPQLTGTAPGSPNASGTPRIVGAAEAGSTVRIFAGSDCSGAPIAVLSAAELGAPGVQVNVAEGTTAVFSANATDAAGNASPCSAPISYTRLKTPPPPPPVKPTCVVPKLAGKSLKQAKKALKAANCKLGEVTKPKPPKGKKGKKKPAPALVVKSSSPRPGAKPADGKVDVKLGPKPPQKKKNKKKRQ